MPGQSPLDRKCAGRANRLGENVETDNGTAGGRSNPQRWASRSTSHIEQGLLPGNAEPFQEPVLLVRGQPTVLPDILAKGLTADARVQVGLKIPIVGVVVASG